MKKAAFTLIELLVVITVIAILAGIALPVYGKVLEKSRATTDASNLKQLGLGIAAYLNDNEELIFSKEGNGGKYWPEILQTKYVTSWKVFQSPFDKIKDPRKTESPNLGSVAVSYGMNANVMDFSLKSPPAAGAWNGNFSRLASPSQLILMAPAMIVDPKTKVMTFSGTASTGVAVNTPAETTAPPYSGTHNSGAQINALFADTHVATLRYGPSKDTEAYSNTKLESGLQRWMPLGK